MSLPTVAVVGAGHVGSTLASRWASRGYPVVLGARDPRPVVDGVATVPIAEALDGADVVVVTVVGSALGDVVSTYGAQLDGKIVIDATNNLAGPPVNRVISERLHQGELFARHAPSASWYRAFNTLAVQAMGAVAAGDAGQHDLFYCGPEEHRDLVEGLITAFGFRPVLVGGSGHADVLDGITRAYFTLMIDRGHGRFVAFGLDTVAQP